MSLRKHTQLGSCVTQGDSLEGIFLKENLTYTFTNWEARCLEMTEEMVTG